MPWYLILGVGLIFGALADRALIVLGDYLTRRPVTRRAIPDTEPKKPQLKAADILGYNDLGGRYIAPTHPVTRGARNSVTALAAWDRRNRREVA